METKRFKVVMLPTEKASGLYKLNKKMGDYKIEALTNHSNALNFPKNYYTNQHLYIISNDKIKEGDYYDKIKEGDYCYRISTNSISKCIKSSNIFGTTEIILENGAEITSQECRKIVATSDKLLTEYCKGVHREGEGCNLNSTCNYPNCRIKSIPESFIQYYIKSYNDGKLIEEVDLRMKSISNPNYTGSGDSIMLGYKIKTNSDNTIIIH